MPRLFRLFVAFTFSLFAIGSAQAEVRVLTSIKPLQLIAAAVLDGVAVPEVLLPPGASPHNYALRPSDVRKVQSVDLLYWIGPDMEGFLPRVLKGRSLPSVAVQDLPGMRLRHFAEDSHSHAEDADEHDHDHRPGTLDAHLWLSPINARVIATRMAADLSAADPANAARYQNNLKAFSERLDALDARLKARLAGIAGKPYFVFHEASFRLLRGRLRPQARRGVQRGSGSPAGGPARRRHARALAAGGQDLCVQRAAPAPAPGGNPGGRPAGETGGAGCVGRLHAGNRSRL